MPAGRYDDECTTHTAQNKNKTPLPVLFALEPALDLRRDPVPFLPLAFDDGDLAEAEVVDAARAAVVAGVDVDVVVLWCGSHDIVVVVVCEEWVQADDPNDASIE